MISGVTRSELPYLAGDPPTSLYVNRPLIPSKELNESNDFAGFFPNS